MISKARLAMTSLAFMFVEVPAPPWMQSTGNWSSMFPARIRSQAAQMAMPISRGNTCNSIFARAQAFLTQARAQIISGNWESGVPEIWKLFMARNVCTP